MNVKNNSFVPGWQILKNVKWQWKNIKGKNAFPPQGDQLTSKTCSLGKLKREMTIVVSRLTSLSHSPHSYISSYFVTIIISYFVTYLDNLSFFDHYWISRLTSLSHSPLSYISSYFVTIIIPYFVTYLDKYSVCDHYWISRLTSLSHPPLSYIVISYFVNITISYLVTY